MRRHCRKLRRRTEKALREWRLPNGSVIRGRSNLPRSLSKTLAKNITRDIVLAAHNEGKLGISFGRYGDAPERNGIPAKSFAIVANDELTLEAEWRNTSRSKSI